MSNQVGERHERREAAGPCFCGNGRITEFWFDGVWSEVLLQCAACDRIYEYKVVDRDADGTEKTAWVKRETELRSERPDGRGNPLLSDRASDHDYTGKPALPSLFGPQFAKDSAGNMFSQPELSDLKHFDTVGALYVMQSEFIPEFLKVGITTRPLKQRAKEHTEDFKVCKPFQVLAAWKMRNYRMVEYFLMRRLLHLRSDYVKGRRYFRDIREGKLCIRTHRSSELYKVSFDEAFAQIALILNKAPELAEFEQWFLDWLTRQLEAFHGKPSYISSWRKALDKMQERLSKGDTSMCVLEILHSA